MDNLENVVASGDRRASLEAIRDVLAAKLANERLGNREVAPIANQLVDVINEINAIAAEVDEQDSVLAKVLELSVTKRRFSRGQG